MKFALVILLLSIACRGDQSAVVQFSAHEDQQGFELKGFDDTVNAGIGFVGSYINETIAPYQQALQDILDGRTPQQLTSFVKELCGESGLGSACFQQKVNQCLDDPLRCALNTGGKAWDKLCPCGLSVKLLKQPQRTLCCVKQFAEYACSQFDTGCIQLIENGFKSCQVTGCPNGFSCQAIDGLDTCFEQNVPGDETLESSSLPSPSPIVSTPVSSTPDPSALEKFNIEMDWNPTSCYGTARCKTQKVINAFTISEMTAKQFQRDKPNDRCWNQNSAEAKSLVVSSEVSPDTLNALKCILQNGEGSDEELWKELYVKTGSCTGLPPKEYFATIVKLFTSIGLNSIAKDYGANAVGSSGDIMVDRDNFLDYISGKLGKKVWIECDPKTRLLRVVLACVNPSPPYNIIDCTIDRTDPESTNGIPCAGELRLPRNQLSADYPSLACEPYFYSKTSIETIPSISSAIDDRRSMIFALFSLPLLHVAARGGWV